MVLGVGIAGAIFATTLAHGSSDLLAPGGLSQENLIFRALQLSFLAASLITMLGVITSLVRPKPV
jgi:hypothetical protein